MKIPEFNLATYENFILNSPNKTLSSDIVVGIIRYLREAQELIEKFEPRWFEELCAYCDAYSDQPCAPDCPFAIRERLGYGQHEG